VRYSKEHKTRAKATIGRRGHRDHPLSSSSASSSGPIGRHSVVVLVNRSSVAGPAADSGWRKALGRCHRSAVAPAQLARAVR
jgi:hypothetical protein